MIDTAAYARYSTDRQNENSIDTQLAAIGQYCRQNGHRIVATFVDMAMTGTNTERPDFQRMVDAAKAGLFECIVVYDITRASRDVADWMNFRKEMRGLGVQVLSTAENLGAPDDPASFLQELLTAGIGQHMVLQSRVKSIAGVAQKAQQGVFLGGVPPLGYDVHKGAYVVNEREARAVRAIFSIYATGGSYNAIIDKVAALGVKGKRGQPIGKNSLNSILQNERYIGIYTWNKRKVKYFGHWAGGVPNPEAVRIEGIIPAIIDTDTWERVQIRMKENKKNARNSAKQEYMLSGMIECGECGGSFTGKTNTSGKGYTTRYYVCNNKYRTRTCKAQNINADEIETAVVAHLVNYLTTTDFDTIADEAMAAYNKTKTARPAEEKELAKLRQQQENIKKILLQRPDYADMFVELDDIKQQIAVLENTLALPKETTISKEMIVAQLKKDVANLKPEDMPRLVKSYITKIYAHDDKLVITGGVNLIGCGGRI
ncbi:recombinase family protein [Ruminococcaceae bacterium OttesenSCG-928-I18]|nr:recombinase family protein [Ruminococcaceae bacterium OttesenSCG-928-I18]